MLSGKRGCGPYYSIPHQVAAQKQFDNVMWLNMNDVESQDWVEWANVKTRLDYPSLSLKDLPSPFNMPDFVFIQEQYNYFNNKMIKEIQKKNIPYIIVPRCSLTAEALKKKKLKKIIANTVYFNKFIKRARAIQYLTEKEKKSSGEKWNNNAIVIPNGIDIPKIKKTFHNDCVQCSFIGRVDIYHKGLDLLLDVCGRLKDKLIEHNISISIYGDGEAKDLEYVNNNIRNKNIEKIVSYKGPIYGSDKERVLLNTDAFILTSRFEGLPMGLLEALSYGIPILATEGTNMTYEIDKVNAGWTCKTDVDSIEKMFLQFIRNLDKLPILSKNCVKLARLYSWSAIAKKTHDILLHELELLNKETSL